MPFSSGWPCRLVRTSPAERSRRTLTMSSLKNELTMRLCTVGLNTFHSLQFGGDNALVNQIPHYPPPGQMRGFDKEIDEKHLPQGRAFDMTP